MKKYVKTKNEYIRLFLIGIKKSASNKIWKYMKIQVPIFSFNVNACVQAVQQVFFNTYS